MYYINYSIGQMIQYLTRHKFKEEREGERIKCDYEERRMARERRVWD